MELVLTFSTSLLLAIGLIPLFARRALQWQLVDHPSEARKVHRQPIPRIGGICIVASGLVGSAYWLLPLDFADYELASVLVGGIIIAGFGLLDDRFDLGYRVKFLGQILATLPLLAGGVYFQVIPFWGVEPAPVWISMPLTFFFMLGAINAVNLADGLDGLAGGIMLLSLTLISVLAMLSGQHDSAILAVGVIGGLLGFLRFNTHPASVFMGDAGSQFLGFITAALAIKVTQYDAVAVSRLLPLFVVGLPVIDTLLVMGIRLMQGRPLFKADKNHTHHQLMMLGFRHYEAVALIYILQAALLGIAWTMRYEDDIWLLLAYTSFSLVVMGAIGAGRGLHWQLHGRAEFAAGYDRRNQLLRRFEWFYGHSSHVILVLLAFFLVGCAYGIETRTPGLSKIAAVIAGVGCLLWLFDDKFRLSKAGLTRFLVYASAAVLVYALLIDREYRPVFNMAIDVYLVATVATLALAIRMTRRDVFRLDNQDLLVALIILTIPLMPFDQYTEVQMGRVALRFAVLLYCCEYLLGKQLRSYALLNLCAIGGLALLAIVS